MPEQIDVEGFTITSKTTRAEMLEIIKTLIEKVHTDNTEGLSKLQQMEKDLRAKWPKIEEADQITVLVTATEDEWIQTVEFLNDIQDIIPTALRRLHVGGQAMFEKELSPDK